MPINPHYAAYSRAHGRSIDAMMEHDRKEYPGGCMCGFILWISKQSQAMYDVHPEAFLERGRIRDGVAWAQWLQDQADIEARKLISGKSVDGG